MADVDAWDSIRRHGLLSTTALLDLFEISGEERHAIECGHRPECVTITHPQHGRAVIRDQKPMSDSSLKRSLHGAGLSPSEWYQLLNRKTFFWLTTERLTRLLQARAHRAQPHCVITVDTRKLIQQHLQQIVLSPINSGATKPMPHPRNADTFQAVANYSFEAWARKRGGARKAIAELAVNYSVPSLAEMVIRVEIRQGTNTIKNLVG